MEDLNALNWDPDKIDSQNWEATAQVKDEYVELKKWELIKIDKINIKHKIAFLDGIVKSDPDIFDISTKSRIKLFNLASGICEIIPYSYNDFNAFKSIKTKKIAIPDKDIPYSKIKVRNSYELLPKETDYLSILKQLEHESLLDYTGDAKFIIWDGSLPITFDGLKDKYVFGLIKSHRRYFMSNDNLEFLYEIKAFERTPIIYYTYTSQDVKKYYYTWYTTLNNNITGLVRIEMLADVKIEEASKIADKISYYLRFFASDPIYEDRAPQNLAPISTLERYLKYYIGYHFVDKAKFL